MVALAIALAWTGPDAWTHWNNQSMSGSGSGSDTATSLEHVATSPSLTPHTAESSQTIANGDTQPGVSATAIASPSPSPSDSQCALLPVPVVSLEHSSAGAAAATGWADLSYPELAALRRPLVLRGPGAVWSQWGALNASASAAGGRWSWGGLVRALPTLRSYRKAQPLDQPTFASWRDLHGSPLASLSGLRREEFSHTHDVDSRCVLRPDQGDDAEDGDAADTSADSFDSSHCAALHEYVLLQPHSLPASLRADLEPLAPLVLSERPQVNLWLGRGGLRTHTHSDQSWNFNAQIKGTKVWTLFPPGSRLRIYPDSHPHQTHTFPAPHLRPEGALEGCAPFRLRPEARRVVWDDELDVGAPATAPSAAAGPSSTLSRRLPLPAYRVELRALGRCCSCRLGGRTTSPRPPLHAVCRSMYGPTRTSTC